jgi:hypothetical protein
MTVTMPINNAVCRTWHTTIGAGPGGMVVSGWVVVSGWLVVSG